MLRSGKHAANVKSRCVFLKVVRTDTTVSLSTSLYNVSASGDESLV